MRKGDFEYEELVARAEEQLQRVEEAFRLCELPERPDSERANEVVLEIREAIEG